MFFTMATKHRLAGLFGLLLIIAGLPVFAQTLDGEPTDLNFTVINATTGEPGTVDRMTIEYVRARRNGILDFEPSGSTFVAPGVPIREAGNYIVAVWHEGVPYWWSLRGRQLIGQTTTLHVFDTTTELDDVVIKGLNVVIRRQETLVRLEYMLQVENTQSPQKTILDRVATFELDIPAAASRIEATYRRGPDPTSFTAEAHGSKRLSLALPLTPGLNQIQIKAVVPWQEGLEVPVGSSLEILAWSVLAAPEWLDIQAMELESGDSTTPGFKRLSGPPLRAGRELPLRIFSGEHDGGEAGNLFDADSMLAASDKSAGADEPADKAGFPWLLVFGGAVIIILAVRVLRNRR